MKMMDTCYPEDVTVIKRDEILKYILTVNPKVKKNKSVEANIAMTKGHYPAVRWTEEAYHTFHSALMGKEPSKMDKFWGKYTDTSPNAFQKMLSCIYAQSSERTIG